MAKTDKSPKLLHGVLSAIGVALGMMLLLVEIVTFVLPIPIGAILIILGFALLAAASRRVVRWIGRRREYNPRFDGFMARHGETLPGWIGKLVRRTNPESLFSITDKY